MNNKFDDRKIEIISIKKYKNKVCENKYKPQLSEKYFNKVNRKHKNIVSNIKILEVKINIWEP